MVPNGMDEDQQRDTMITGSHNFPRQDAIVYGRPAEESLTIDARDNRWRRAFVVSSRSVASTPYFRHMMHATAERVAGIYSEVTAHSPYVSVLGGARAASEVNADVLVAIGGGSVIDAAKAIQYCLSLGLSNVEHLQALSNEPRAIPAPTPIRMIAIPTTLSAAEFTPIAGITDTARGVKAILSDPFLVPRLVILDPAATIATPERLFLGTGIRAIDHCVETLCSSAPTPFGNAVASEGLRLLVPALKRVCAAADDLDARTECQLGAWLGVSGPVSGVPVGASHAIGRVLGAACGVPHGETSCVLLPAVLTWNLSHAGSPQAAVSTLLGAPDQPAAAAVRALISDLGLPASLRELGVGPEHFGEIAEKSLAMVKVASTSGNPRPVRTQEDVLDILALANG